VSLDLESVLVEVIGGYFLRWEVIGGYFLWEGSEK
jgi:hypothetical protein